MAWFQALLVGLTGRSVTWTFLTGSGLTCHTISSAMPAALSLMETFMVLWGVSAWRQGCCSGETAF